MSMNLSRRDFNKLMAAGAAGSALSLFGGVKPAFAARHRVVVIGGGFGGAATARYLKKLDPSIAVTLVEPKAEYITCPFTNWVLADIKTLKDLTLNYKSLQQHGVNVVADTVKEIDTYKSLVRLKGGKVLPYDRLVVSPGIDFRFDAIPGYTQEVAETKIPHAYQAGPQTELLRKQIHAMKDGGTVVICPPEAPYRCPPGPYERASLIALYLQQHKPKSKVIILDPKEKFSKGALFKQGWARRYPNIIEWRGPSAGGKVLGIDAGSMTITTDQGPVKADVINVIPPQKAGKLAFDSGLVDGSGWCPINPISFESMFHPGIHVVGDACQAGAMPKSGYAASSQGKVAAAAIVRLFRGQVPAPPSLVNTCYSLIGPEYGISIAGIYKLTTQGIIEIPNTGGVTPIDADEDHLRQEAMFAQGWYDNIVRDIWG